MVLCHHSDPNRNFGRWELCSHNCEDFARFCKILKLGSKQAIRGVVSTVALAASIVRTIGAGGVITLLSQHAKLKLILNLPMDLDRNI